LGKSLQSHNYWSTHTYARCENNSLMNQKNVRLRESNCQLGHWSATVNSLLAMKHKLYVLSVLSVKHAGNLIIAVRLSWKIAVECYFVNNLTGCRLLQPVKLLSLYSELQRNLKTRYMYLHTIRTIIVERPLWTRIFIQIIITITHPFRHMPHLV